VNEKLHHFYLQTQLLVSKKRIHDPHSDDALEIYEKSPNGIFAILEESCVLRMTEKAMFEGIKARCANHPRFLPSRFSSDNNRTFTINHFAGKVLYTVTDFIPKNKGVLHEQFVACFQQSHLEFVRELFSSAGTNEASLHVPLGSKRRVMDTRVKKRRERTAINEITAAIDTITTSFQTGDAYYVCCIKPNAAENSESFTRSRTA